MPNAIFPQSLIVGDDGTAKVYYGAADYVERLAAGDLGDVIEACHNR